MTGRKESQISLLHHQYGIRFPSFKKLEFYLRCYNVQLHVTISMSSICITIYVVVVVSSAEEEGEKAEEEEAEEEEDNFFCQVLL